MVRPKPSHLHHFISNITAIIIITNAAPPHRDGV